jgi:hypothetical protein
MGEQGEQWNVKRTTVTKHLRESDTELLHRSIFAFADRR